MEWEWNDSRQMIMETIGELPAAPKNGAWEYFGGDDLLEKERMNELEPIQGRNE
jgi:hypothetical protein